MTVDTLKIADVCSCVMGVWKPEQRIANSREQRTVNSLEQRIANSEQRIVRIVRIVANSLEKWRIVANSGKQQQIGYPVSSSQPRSNLGWDFPAKKHRRLSGQKGGSKRNFFCFNRCKSVNMSLLGYPCVFCFLEVVLYLNFFFAKQLCGTVLVPR